MILAEGTIELLEDILARRRVKRWICWLTKHGKMHANPSEQFLIAHGQIPDEHCSEETLTRARVEMRVETDSDSRIPLEEMRAVWNNTPPSGGQT